MEGRGRMSNSTPSNHNLLESELNQTEFQKALSYVCYERIFYYISKEYYQFDRFPLLFLDRFIGWRYSPGPEPVLPVYNGFEEMLARRVKQEKNIPRKDFSRELRQIFADGHMVSLYIWATHTDSTRFATAALLEGMKDAGEQAEAIVYFTRIHQTYNKLRLPMPFSELESQLYTEDDGSAPLVIIMGAAVFEEIQAMNLLDSYRYIFADLFGYRMESGSLLKDGKQVELDLSGFTEFRADLDLSLPKILGEGKVSKYHQNRMHKQIYNKIYPTQQHLSFILERPELMGFLPRGLAADIGAMKERIDSQLNEMLKFTSLFVQLPRADFFEKYLNALERFISLLPAYQGLNLEVLQLIA
jgi:hypothetical protein